MNNPNEFPNSNSIYDQGKYAYGPNEEYEDDNYGGVDPNDMDYYDDSQDNDEDHGDDYSANNEDDDLFHTYSGVVHTSPAPDLLLAILEAAVRDDETLTRDAPQSNGGFPEDVQRNLRDHLERTWKAVRTHWLWAFETAEERSAGALLRGANGLAPLHLVCKLDGNPPTDVWEAIVEAAPEVAGWLDSHGWLPLHHACLRGASTEVLKLLTEVCPSARAALDAHRRTPLHLYATRGTNSDNHPSTMARNYRILCAWSAEDDEESWSPAEARDAAGMLPMHYACAYGTTRSVLRVLEEAFPDGLEARDDHGRTPLHLVMVNAQRSASPGVLGYILGHVDDENGDEADHYGDGNLKFEIATIGARRIPKSASVNVRDRGGNLPLHLLNLGLVGADLDRDRDKRNHASECLQLYLEAQPHVSTDFLAALQALPEPLQDVAVVSPHVRNILNAKIIQRFPTSILMLDGIMLVTMIVCFEVATTRFVDFLVDVDGTVENTDLRSPLVMLYITAAYFFLRELIQVIASLALGIFRSWLYDTTNWLDVLVIALVTHFTTNMALGEEILLSSTEGTTEDYLGNFRTGTALTKGVLWTAVIFFLRSTQVDFAVFLNGVFYVVRRLVAFLLAMLVILISFAQMFWLVYLEQPVCKFSCSEGDTECQAEMDGCNYPHCEFGDSFLKVYTMMMGEIGSETRYDQNLVAQILYILYGFFIVILLSNVLIAIVTDSYEIVQNDRAAIVFWSNRLDFVAEMDSIASVVRKRIFGTNGDDDAKKDNTSMVPNDTHDDSSSESSRSFSDVDSRRVYGTEEWFRDQWNSIMSMFEHDAYGAASEDNRPIDFWYDVLNKTLAILMIPPWLILGFVTVGILWPPQVREWLFVQKNTAASRAEIERRKLEQLQGIQKDTKRLKDELRMDMQHDREEMFRVKGEVDAVQEEVLADLQQVNALVTTLLTDLGGTPLVG